MMVRFLAELDKLDFDTLDALAVDAKKFPVLKDKEQTIALGTDTETVRLQPQDLPVFDALNAIPSPPAELADRRKMRGDLIQECSQYEPDKIATWLAKIERLESLTKSITLQNEPLAMVKVALQKAYEAKWLVFKEEVANTLTSLKSADSEITSIQDRTLSMSHAHTLQTILNDMSDLNQDHDRRVIEMATLAQSARTAIENANNFLQTMKKEAPKMAQIVEQVAASRDKVAGITPVPDFPPAKKSRESIFDKLLEIKCLKRFVEWRKGKTTTLDQLSAMDRLQGILDNKKSKPTEKLDQFGQSVNQHSSALGNPFVKAIQKIREAFRYKSHAAPTPVSEAENKSAPRPRPH